MNATATRWVDVPSPMRETIIRTKRQRIRAFRVSPGVYKVPSFETRGMRRCTWFEVHVARRLDSFQIICNHPQVMGYSDDRDAFGNSTCKHAVAVGLRLLRSEDERNEILRPTAPRSVKAGLYANA